MYMSQYNPTQCNFKQREGTSEGKEPAQKYMNTHGALLATKPWETLGCQESRGTGSEGGTLVLSAGGLVSPQAERVHPVPHCIAGPPFAAAPFAQQLPGRCRRGCLRLLPPSHLLTDHPAQFAYICPHPLSTEPSSSLLHTSPPSPYTPHLQPRHQASSLTGICE